MLALTNEAGELRVSTLHYTLTCAKDRPFVYVDDQNQRRLAELFVLSSVHTSNSQDDTVRIGDWMVEATDSTVTLSLKAESSLWASKVYSFECTADRFRYRLTVEGKGRLAEVDYFGGYYSGHLRWGSGFFWSGQQFLLGFNPEPNGREIHTFAAACQSVIDLTGVPLPGRGDWFFTPPPFCFAFQGESGWMSMGLETCPGENRYTELRYQGHFDGFFLSLHFEGHTIVDGSYTLPAIGFDFSNSPYEGLEKHVTALARQNYVTLDTGRPHSTWWHSPIYCGWGSQCYIASIEGGRAPDYARQNRYEQFLAALTDHRIDPGIIVLDDKWQSTYGNNRVDTDKWPDIKGFITKQHQEGRKVLLWIKAWDPEGVPASECIRNAANIPIAVDPTCPTFEERLRDSIRVMLDDYDADGFKIDFTARIPSGPSIQLYRDDIWGLELMKAYLSIFYDEAKRVKPDALVMAHTPHPYLADVVDMIRLNDINVNHDVDCAMTHRAKVATIACPCAVIDTDNWPIKNLETWRAYTMRQPELGVPSLYYATHIDTTGEALQEGDYRLIREIWAQYRSSFTEIACQN